MNIFGTGSFIFLEVMERKTWEQMLRSKSVGWIAAVCALAGLSAWISFAVVIYLEGREMNQHIRSVVNPYNALGQKLQAEGLPADLQDELARLPKDQAVTGYALVDANTRQVVAGDTPEAAGKRFTGVGAAHSPSTPDDSFTSQDLRTPDGHSYQLVAFASGLPIGYSRAAHLGLGLAGSLFTIAAWLSLALWLFTDAWQRSPTQALAWGFLGLVTGPLVWRCTAWYVLPRRFAPAPGRLSIPADLFAPSMGSPCVPRARSAKNPFNTPGVTAGLAVPCFRTKRRVAEVFKATVGNPVPESCRKRGGPSAKGRPAV